MTGKSFRTHYDNLKVARDAPLEVIRAAYKTLSQKHHPDRNPGNPNAAGILVILNAAYEVLSDPVKREQHDQWIRQQEQSSEHHTMDCKGDTCCDGDLPLRQPPPLPDIGAYFKRTDSSSAVRTKKQLGPVAWWAAMLGFGGLFGGFLNGLSQSGNLVAYSVGVAIPTGIGGATLGAVIGFIVSHWKNAVNLKSTAPSSAKANHVSRSPTHGIKEQDSHRDLSWSSTALNWIGITIAGVSIDTISQGNQWNQVAQPVGVVLGVAITYMVVAVVIAAVLHMFSLDKDAYRFRLVTVICGWSMSIVTAYPLMR
jgi:hypothetical protein